MAICTCTGHRIEDRPLFQRGLFVAIRRFTVREFSVPCNKYNNYISVKNSDNKYRVKRLLRKEVQLQQHDSGF